jgi:hypothetical protein
MDKIDKIDKNIYVTEMSAEATHPLSDLYDIIIIKSYPIFWFVNCNYCGPKVKSLDYIIPKTITFIKTLYDPIYQIPASILVMKDEKLIFSR